MPLARLLLAFAAAAGLAAAQPAVPTPLPELIDTVLANPSDPEARARLSTTAQQASGRRKKAIAAEKAALLAAAKLDRDKMQAMRAAKAARVRAWKTAFDKVCSLASDVDEITEAASAYEALLESSPVYSDNRVELVGASEKVKRIFYKTIKREYPHLVHGRDRINERDIASLLFYRASTLDDSGRYADTGNTQESLNKAERFRRLERQLGQQYASLAKGISLYSKRHYAEALSLFDEVLVIDRGNEEALYYWGLATEKINPAAGDEAAENDR